MGPKKYVLKNFHSCPTKNKGSSPKRKYFIENAAFVGKNDHIVYLYLCLDLCKSFTYLLTSVRIEMLHCKYEYFFNAPQCTLFLIG